MKKILEARNSPTFWKWIAVMVIAFGYLYFNYLPQRENCQRIAANRNEGQVRFSVLYNFMTSAANRVEKQGSREVREGKTTAGLADIGTAHYYRLQRDRLSNLPDINC